MIIEVSDRYAWKTHLLELQTVKGSYGRFFSHFKKNVVLAAYLSMGFAITIFMYYFIYIPDMEQSQWSTNYETQIEKDIESSIDNKDLEQASYDRLLQYILHPQTSCETSLVIGSQGGRENNEMEKVVCVEPGPSFGDGCIVYSFGLNYKWSEGMRNQFGCKVYAFDPRINTEDHFDIEGVSIYNMGIREYDKNIEVDGKVWVMKTLDSIIQKLGHIENTIDLLKLEIEEAECLVLEDILNKGLLNSVNHLCIEIHLTKNQNWDGVLKLFERIEAETELRHFISTRNDFQMPMIPLPFLYESYEQDYFQMTWFRFRP